MAVEVHIENIFPTPLYTSKIDVDDVDVSDIICLPNGPDNIVTLSENVDLLRLEKFSRLKEEIDAHMMHFYTHVLGYYEGLVYPEMTTSWLVKSLSNQESDWHIHANSIFSGVLYLNEIENCGDLILSTLSSVDDRQIIPLLQPPVRNTNIYNYRYHRVKPHKGLLLLFPSLLRHKVEKNLSNKERLSIAFNFFLKGKFDQRTAFLELK